MNGTIIQQGSFTSSGNPQIIQLVSGVDWVETTNYTQIAAAAVATGYSFYWQLGSDNQIGGLPAGSCFEDRSNAGGTAINRIISTLGFTVVDATTDVPLAPVAVTAISNANPPIVSTGSTVGLFAGDIVEIINVQGALQFGGIYFAIDTIVTNTSFRLPYAPQIAAGTTGFYRKIPDDAVFFPRRRFITAMTTGVSTLVTVSSTISFPHVPGQFVRLYVPPQYGSRLSQNINGVGGTILAINDATNTLTIDINSTGFGTFTFPTSAQVPFTQAQLVPVGEGAGDFDPSIHPAQGDTENRATFGLELAPGTDGPAGVFGDVVYWRAGKSFSLDTNS